MKTYYNTFVINNYDFSLHLLIFIANSINDWNTRGTDASGHDENGFVKYGTGAGDITFRFNNPFIGTNTCKMTVENPTLRVDCSITQGNFASLTYNVHPVNGGNGGEDEGEGSGGEGGGY
jgi:hypothetical protein